MSTIISILMTLVIFTLIVVVHEGGHFWAARRAGVTVEEFAVGMGPVLFKFTSKKKTVISFRMLPIGGFCRMYGEEGTPLEENNSVTNGAAKTESVQAETVQGEKEAAVSPSPEEKKVSFTDVSVWKRIFIVAAGPIMNFVLAFVVLLAVNLGFGFVDNRVAKVEEGAPAEQAGMEVGDKILKVDGKRIHIYTEASYELSSYSGEGSVELVVRHADGTKETLIMTPFYDEALSRYRVGFSATSYANIGEAVAARGLWSGIWSTVNETFWYVGYEIKITLVSVGSLITGALGLDALSGPIGIVSVVGEAYDVAKTYGFWTVIGTMASLAVLLSANLGVMNLFPIPGLDGSRIVILLIEKIRKKPLNRTVEAVIYLVGFILLIGLMVVVAINDVLKLF